MQNRFSLLLLIAACLSSAPMGGYAQDNNTTEQSDKPVILYNGTPKKYEIADIKVSTRNISQLANTIEDISFQTNILALNASVEAARAGDEVLGIFISTLGSRSFTKFNSLLIGDILSVEIRRLANQVSEASRAADELAARATASVENGSALIRVTSTSMEGAVAATEGVKEMMSAIAQASTQQLEAVSQIQESMDSLSDVVQENSAASEESAVIGEELGLGGEELDIAVDPLEGTNLCAFGKPNALTTIAIAPRGALLFAPDTYMQKIAAGPACAGKVGIDKTPAESIAAVAAALDPALYEPVLTGITRDGLAARMSDDDFDAVIDINLKGTFHCCRAAAKLMMKQRWGRIVNMSSVVGVYGNAGQVNYAASKAGVIGLTKSLARELARRNITANAVAPGFIATDMTDALSDAQREAIVSRIGSGRLGEPDDIAHLVRFLASDEASYITGQVICVDGGMSL